MAVGDLAFYYTLYLWAYLDKMLVKGTISDHPFQTSRFSKPPDFFFFFCVFRENSLGNNIFLEGETILYCSELIVVSDN